MQLLTGPDNGQPRRPDSPHPEPATALDPVADSAAEGAIVTLLRWINALAPRTLPS